jgi:protocatechuate 3,4-dioxygenase, alpha subunit
MTLPTTPSQTVGPFYSIGLSRRVENEVVSPSDPSGLRLEGRLLDGAGDPIDGVIEIWDVRSRRWGRCGTDEDGAFRFTIAKPEGGDGEAPRLDVYVFARGLLKHQLTRIYFPDETDANAADPVLSALGDEERETLFARLDGDALRFDIRMQGESATVFFAV